MKSFAYISSCAPGQIVNLLAGARPNFSQLLRSSLTRGELSDIQPWLQQDPTHCPIGPELILTPCEDWITLIRTFWRRFQIPGRPEGWFAGAVLQDHAAQKAEYFFQLLNLLGLSEDPIQNAQHYVLAEIPRRITDQPVTMTEKQKALCRTRLKTQSEAWKASVKDKDEPSQLSSLLDWMAQTAGTHVLDQLLLGDCVYQVFVYNDENYQTVCQAMDYSGWTGTSALSFRFFTSSAYCEYPGRVCLLSGHPVLEQVRSQLADPLYSVSESLFSVLLNRSVQQTLCSADQVCCCGFTAEPLADWIENDPELNKICSQFTIQSSIARFGLSLAGPAWNEEPEPLPDYRKLYADFLPESVPVMRSPYTSRAAMVIHLNDELDQSTMNPQDLRHLVLTADVLVIDRDLDLSCCEDLLFSCRRFLCPTTAVTITVSPSGFKQFNLYCLQMCGTLILNDPSDPEHHQIVFGDWASQLSPDKEAVSYTTFFRGHFPTAVFLNPQETQRIRWQKQSLQNGLQTLLLSASVPVHIQNYTDETRPTAVEAWHCLEWIRTYAGQYLNEIESRQEKPNETMSWLFAEAVTLIRGSHDPSDPTPYLSVVPALRYTAYQKTVDRLLVLSRDLQAQLNLAEQRIDAFQAELRRSYKEAERDENLRQIAQFMINQNTALAQKEADMSAAYSQIIHSQENLIQTLSLRKGEILSQYSSYEKELKTKKEVLDTAIEKNLEAERAKASMEFIFSLTEALLGIVSGSFNFALLDSETTDIAKTAKKWDAFLKYAGEINKIISLSESLADYVSKINDLDKLTIDAAIPTEQDWKAFLYACEVKLSTCRSLIPIETGDYLNVIKKLIDTASALNSAVDQIAGAQREIFYQQAMQKVSDAQQIRLEALSLELNSPNWKPEESILLDLGQLEGSLQQRQTRALLMISELVRLQDDSMTYHYLSQPTPILRYDLLSVEETLAAQAASALKALDNYPYPPTDLGPVDVVFADLPVSQLLSDDGVLIEPSMNEGLFRNLARVRIHAMDLRIDGLTTASGRCHIFIETLSDPMLDRGLRQETLSYRMISRRWVVIYDIATGRTIMDTHPAQEWGQYFTKPTPFQKMRIRLAQAEDNRDASIPTETTSVRLSLMLEACPSYRSHWPVNPLALNKEENQMRKNAEEPFVAKLKGLSITDGWDVVSFVSLAKINKLWAERWTAEQNPEFSEYRQFLQHIECHMEETPVFSTLSYDLKADLGAPLLTFRDQKADVRIPILAGTLTITETGSSGSQSQSYSFSQDPKQPAALVTQVELKELSGSVHEKSVAIQINQGAFLLENFTISKIIDVKLANMITTFFKKENIPPWVLGSLRLDTDIPFLKPTQFFFRTYTSSDLYEKTEAHVDVLALYILTVSPAVPAFGMRRTWPKNTWVVTEAQDAAVYFSADLFWNKEIQPALTRDIGPCKVTTTSLPQISWQAQFTDSRVVYDNTADIKEGFEARGNYRIVKEHAIVNFPMDSITVDLTLDSICTHCNAAWDDSFPYQGRTVLPDPDCPDAALNVEWDSVHFTCSYDASTQAVIDPDTFVITFEPIQAADPQVKATYPTKRPWYISSGTVSEDIVKAAKKEITDKLKAPKINLSAMPMFAVSNLLFPEGKVMEPQAVYFPNDLVIVGTGAIPQTIALKRLQSGKAK
ncbi:hypothetical protein [Holdemania massiliensis]|uniref:hypothetical protein n=1 Tax=Holdemania massiliensis TaxID=1468449 RepID=UPI001F06BDD1|nr:hypothetical protein [Holdemania massiliensis]MCH1941806.1 hypothetical protein [Holdemania massiliensis]